MSLGEVTSTTAAWAVVSLQIQKYEKKNEVDTYSPLDAMFTPSFDAFLVRRAVTGKQNLGICILE